MGYGSTTRVKISLLNDKEWPWWQPPIKFGVEFNSISTSTKINTKTKIKNQEF